MARTLEKLFGIDLPIVLGPFGGLSSIGLTAAVSRLGGLGSFGLYGYTPERIHDTVSQLRAATDRPFAVNLWLPIGDEVTPAEVDLGPTLTAMTPLYEAAGIEVPPPPERFLPDVDEQISAVIDAGPAALSVVFGVPSGRMIDEARGLWILPK